MSHVKTETDLVGVRVDRAIYRAALSKAKTEGNSMQKLLRRRVERILRTYVERKSA